MEQHSTIYLRKNVIKHLFCDTHKIIKQCILSFVRVHEISHNANI